MVTDIGKIITPHILFLIYFADGLYRFRFHRRPLHEIKGLSGITFLRIQGFIHHIREAEITFQHHRLRRLVAQRLFQPVVGGHHALLLAPKIIAGDAILVV